MHILGTAGHVDHGKTKLIQALTGIDPDRLPEEKARGMTIDLGFAHFPGPGGEPVGVIDVPGHERFIRNMVAGAWSLSSGLLVVAADDCWMQQSEDHARVLRLMNINPVILVVTKSDLVSLDELELVRDDALEQCLRVFGYLPESVVVSAKTGQGIQELKEKIISTLTSLPPAKSDGPVCCYIDRVFSVKGAGTVVTGSLVGGYLSEGQGITLLPQARRVQIRSIQSYYTIVKRAEPVSRVALNLQAIRAEELRRGLCITDNPEAFWRAKEFIIALDPAEIGVFGKKKQLELEVAYGTDHQVASFYLLKGNRTARIVVKNNIAVHWRQRCLLIRHGGSSILSGGCFVWPGKTTQAERNRCAEIYAHQSAPGEIIHFNQMQLLVLGWVPSGKDDCSSTLLGTKVVRCGTYQLSEGFHSKLVSAILKRTATLGGSSVSELSTQLHLPVSLLEAIIPELVSSKQLVQNDLFFSAAHSGTEAQRITKVGEQILGRMKVASNEGIELKSLSLPSAHKELRQLVRTGLVVPLQNGIYYPAEKYRELVGMILRGFRIGDRFSIPEAKDRVLLSRKYMIPLLNRMEQDGYVRREENERLVLKQIDESNFSNGS